MSSSDHYDVGYRKPPVEHHFSTDRQPRRRKKEKAKGQGHDVLTHVRQALNKDVLVTVGGKSVKTKVHEVFARRFVNQGVNGTFSDQIKFARFLQEHGHFDSEKIIEDIQEEHSHRLQLERERYRILLGLFKASASNGLDLLSKGTVISSAFVAAKSKCTCEAFEGDEEAYQLVIEWTLEDVSEATIADGSDPFAGGGSGCAQMSGVTFSGATDAASPASANEYPNEVHQSFPSDDLSAGTIGND